MVHGVYIVVSAGNVWLESVSHSLCFSHGAILFQHVYVSAWKKMLEKKDNMFERSD